MASGPESPFQKSQDSMATFLQSLPFKLFSTFPLNINKPKPKEIFSSTKSSGESIIFADGAMAMSSPFSSSSLVSSSYQNNELASPSSSVKRMSSGFPSNVRIDGLASNLKGGPAFVGQVFSMCDPSGTGLMAVSSRVEIPFSARVPDWIKKGLSMLMKNERNGPVFRFFMDLGDAVAYVKQLNIPTGMVGACRLDVAYEHFKEKPHMFKFVPNKKQVKAANRLLKTVSRTRAKRRLEGVPVFTARNLSIAIATTDGIKWYTPYFFDKTLLDNILEASIDQHFHTLIQNRHMQRRRDAIDDNLAAEVVEENFDNLFEPPEVQEVLEEMGHPALPLSLISKAAEIQFLDVVDRVLLGNRWLRKATGIQPKFPYLVDSFEERSAASLLKATESISSESNISISKTDSNGSLGFEPNESNEHLGTENLRPSPFAFPFRDWFSRSAQPEKRDTLMKPNSRMQSKADEAGVNPLLPRITMVGISTSEAGRVNKLNLKKTMEELTQELEQKSQKLTEHDEEKDPLFVANVGDYSTITRMGSP
ncbi:hypothetical protein AMTRI_Chr01g109500 [Amborella trichopoda]|uniref:Tic22-like family protein n=1 Tax=Amborella trichopoda TaxID=13333 RepID=W1PBM3_AMBTC|nr:uncharacterized protein LOC18433183 [Amborella trichopoda]ERN05011.1 hypothetical protein AMTR_s00053p00021770 [Amborella trichopoda]|eukprot:XP_006843336.1 uncharacterized protein LOC18433183 [Amborella trichopoda]